MPWEPVPEGRPKTRGGMRRDTDSGHHYGTDAFHSDQLSFDQHTEGHNTQGASDARTIELEPHLTFVGREEGDVPAVHLKHGPDPGIQFPLNLKCQRGSLVHRSGLGRSCHGRDVDAHEPTEVEAEDLVLVLLGDLWETVILLKILRNGHFPEHL